MVSLEVYNYRLYYLKCVKSVLEECISLFVLFSIIVIDYDIDDTCSDLIIFIIQYKRKG